MNSQQFSLFELQGIIKNAVELAVPDTIWVRAEISEMTVNRNGHCYLDLVETNDTDNIIARIRGTIWSYTFRMLKPYFESTTKQIFSEGIKVLLNVKVEYHEAYGISLNIRDIDPTYTLGDMAQKRQIILSKLQEEGVLEMNKELEIPMVPQRIAIISSPTAAGLQDFLNQLGNNSDKIKFYTKLFPAVMQGKKAPESIMNALDRIFAYENFFDIVVIIRGGGAQVDLATFDNYELAFHITQFPLPVLTGIGHDKDDSVADLVAHTRLKTPTAVADFLISTVKEFTSYLANLDRLFAESVNAHLQDSKGKITDLLQTMHHTVRLKIKDERQNLKISQLQLSGKTKKILEDKKNTLYTLANNIKSTTKTFVHNQQSLLNQSKNRTRFEVKTINWKKETELKRAIEKINTRTNEKLKVENQRLYRLDETLRLVDPQQILKRGFSITLKNGKLLKSVQQLKNKDLIETHFNDGKTISKVQNISTEKTKK